jgi:hypothetical protein
MHNKALFLLTLLLQELFSLLAPKRQCSNVLAVVLFQLRIKSVIPVQTVWQFIVDEGGLLVLTAPSVLSMVYR